MEVTGSSIEQVEKGKPKSRCRKWRLWATTDHGRKSKRFDGTYTQAQQAMKSFAEDLSGKIPNADKFASYAESWRSYRKLSGDYAQNTIARDKHIVGSIIRSPMGERRMDSITPETCRDDLIWIKTNPQKDGVDALSGTMMRDIYKVMHQILVQAFDDGLISSDPMARIKPPKPDTEEREALPWDELMAVLDRLDEMPLNAFVMSLYAIICHGLRRGESCGLLDDDVTNEWTIVRCSVSESDGMLKAPKSKAGVRKLPAVERFVKKVGEWRMLRHAFGWDDAETLICDTRGGILRPQNLYRWWMEHREELGCGDMTLHQFRHSNLTHVARHMSVFDLMRYAGWSSPGPAQVYIHDDYTALSNGVADAWK